MKAPVFLSRNKFALLVVIGIILNATCFFNDILEPDGTLYAFIAKQIVLSNDWINLWDKGHDWLDKPHLPFWLAAVSFKIFGINSFAYKLPSFICWLIGIFYCYKLSAKIYNVATARLTTIIYITLLYVIVANFDVRAEAYLTAFIIAAIYHMYRAMDKKWLLHIIIAAIFCACSIMTKGIFTAITIASGFIIYWIKTKEWNEFFKLKWYLLALLSFIFILPELYSLYIQFDLHPEKTVFGKTHVSGLKFFFWDSQFGRFVNSGPIKGSGSLFFFFHTLLWEFMPWIIFLLVAIIALFKKINKPGNNRSWIIGSSALVTFIMFSLSKFQLPHYLIIIFPQLSMLTAWWILELASESTLKKLDITQTIFFLLLSILIIGIARIFVFDNAIWLYIPLAIGLIFIFFFKSNSSLLNIINKNIVFALLLAIFLNCFFYPSILPYQSGMVAGRWLNNNYNNKEVKMYKCYSNALEFYCNGNVLPADNLDSLLETKNAKDSILLFTPLKEVNDILENHNNINLTILKSFEHFHVSQVSGKFLTQATRKMAVETFDIVLIKRKF